MSIEELELYRLVEETFKVDSWHGLTMDIAVPVEDVRVDESRPWPGVDNDVMIPENPSLTGQ
jgi:hypothetical protein